MINKIINLGQAVLEKEKYYDDDTAISLKNSIILRTQMITPKSYQQDDDTYLMNRKAIILNFNLEDKKIEIKLSIRDCYEKNLEYFSAFTPNTPNGAKIFLSSNTLAKSIENIFNNQILYISKSEKRQKYIKNIISEDYIVFLKSISQIFYDDPVKNDKNKIDSESKINVLKKELFNNYDKELSIIENINFDFFNKEKNLEKVPMVGKVCNNIFMITFNNQTIKEFEGGKYYQDYLNICLYDFVDRFYIEEGVAGTDNICHNCGKQGKVTKNSVVPWKFIVPLKLTSENLNSNYSHNNFSICRDCLIKLLVGIKTLENNYSNKLFGLDNYLIPTQIEKNDLNCDIYIKIMLLFKNYNKPNYTQLEEISQIMNRAERRNLNFDIMFYYHNKQQFDVLRLITNVESGSIIEKFRLIDKYSEENRLDEIDIRDKNKKYVGNNSLTFSTLRFSIIKSKYSTKSNLDFKNYGKKLIDLVDKFVSNERFSELTLIKDFVDIYKGRLNNNNIDNLSAFKMVLFLSIFDELNILKHGGNMENKEIITTIQDEKLVMFLERHNSVYKNDPHKQGLFLLGTIISKIKYAQEDKSSNILKRINFEGINTRKVQSILTTIQEFYQIYKKKIYLQESLWGCIYDRLQEIEKSKLTSEEISFYILSGISYQDYLGIIAWIDNKNKITQGEENGN